MVALADPGADARLQSVDRAHGGISLGAVYLHAVLKIDLTDRPKMKMTKGAQRDLLRPRRTPHCIPASGLTAVPSSSDSERNRGGSSGVPGCVPGHGCQGMPASWSRGPPHAEGSSSSGGYGTPQGRAIRNVVR